MDLLGQKDRLTEWSQMPYAGQMPPAFQAAVKKSAGTVLWFREQFEHYFMEFSKNRLTPEQWSQLDAAQKSLYRRARSHHLGSQQFSDTFVFYAPLRNANGDVTTLPVFEIICACAWSTLVSIAGGVPLRGGICIGPGVELDDRTFYGPALAGAHHIESKVAQYPRIVVANEISDFLTDDGVYSFDGTIHRVMQDTASFCSKLLAKDDDGSLIVDYLGAGVKQMMDYLNPNALDFPTAVKKAYDYVSRELERFRREENAKLMQRYLAMHRYFASRLSIWGLQATDDSGVPPTSHA